MNYQCSILAKKFAYKLETSIYPSTHPFIYTNKEIITTMLLELYAKNLGGVEE